MNPIDVHGKKNIKCVGRQRSQDPQERQMQSSVPSLTAPYDVRHFLPRSLAQSDALVSQMNFVKVGSFQVVNVSSLLTHLIFLVATEQVAGRI